MDHSDADGTDRSRPSAHASLGADLKQTAILTNRELPPAARATTGLRVITLDAERIGLILWTKDAAAANFPPKVNSQPRRYPGAPRFAALKTQHPNWNLPNGRGRRPVRAARGGEFPRQRTGS